MAAAVLSPMQGLSLDGGIMPPSPVSQNNSRHGRSRHGGSVVKKGRGRGYSVVDDREGLVSKAITWVLKRTVGEDEEQEEGDEKLVADAEGWVDCEDLLDHSSLSTLEVTLAELQTITQSPKSKFLFKPTNPTQTPEEALDPANYLLRLKPASTRPDSPTSSKGGELTALTSSTSDLPDLIVYETSYPNYPLILASGGIKRAGGQAQLLFSSIKVEEDGTEIRSKSDSDVTIYLDLKSLLADNTNISWSRTESGSIVTEGDSTGSIPTKYWKKAVARRGDIGVLFEHGEVRKEIPIGLRGKGGVKGKRGGGKGKGTFKKELKARSDNDGSASD